jgi:hypothetical protein
VKKTVRVPDVAVIESIVGAAGGCATRTDVSVGAENVRSTIALVARSAIDPLLRSRLVVIAMPSVSNSRGSMATVYRKRAVLESLIERKFAYSVVEPTVRVKRGVPVIVTDSENATVKVGVSEGI